MLIKRADLTYFQELYALLKDVSDQKEFIESLLISIGKKHSRGLLKVLVVEGKKSDEDDIGQEKFITRQMIRQAYKRVSKVYKQS